MESGNPLVSVVIAAYNASEYVGDLLDSLKDQTYTNLEILVVNDGSTDETASVVNDRKKTDNRIQLIEQSNKGVSAARNNGLAVSGGDYVIFIDADDILDKDMICTLVNNSIENDADISICNIKECSNEKETHEVNKVNNVSCISQDEAIKLFLLGKRIRSGAWNKLINKRIIDGLEFEEGKRVNEDKYFCFQLLLRSKKIVYTEAELYCYMQRPGSVSRKGFDDRMFDTLYFADKIYLRLNDSELELFARYSKMITYYSLAKILVETRNKDVYHEQYSKIVSELRKMKLIGMKKYMASSTFLGMILLKVYVPLYEKAMCSKAKI